jgi:hypothetical protein
MIVIIAVVVADASSASHTRRSGRDHNYEDNHTPSRHSSHAEDNIHRTTACTSPMTACVFAGRLAREP